MGIELPQAIADIRYSNPRPAYVEEYIEKPTLIEVFLKHVGDPASTRDAELFYAKAEIEKLAAMPANWDGEGALQICEEAKGNAKATVDAVFPNVPSPEIIPNPNGTISFEWESEKGKAHLEIGRTQFSFYIKPRQGEPLLLDGKIEQISDDLGRIISLWLFPARRHVMPMTQISSNQLVMKL